MHHRRLPDWLLSLLGLWNRTPCGLAARYADSADRSLVLKPVFNLPPLPGLPAPEPQRPALDEAPADTPAPAPAPEAAIDSSRLRAA